jgi:hypothetical protein
LQTRDPKTCDSLVTPYSIDEALRSTGSHHGEAPDHFDFH